MEVTPKHGFPSEGDAGPRASPDRGSLYGVPGDEEETLLAQSVPVPLPRGPHEDLAPGMMLGEYKVERKIGEGGMSAVFAAVHPVIGKRAAIKILKPGVCRDPRAVSRFIDEARAVNQIGHPNIVDVFAFGVLPDGRHYFVMELLHGETLGARMARQRLSLAEICAVLRQLARALAAVHDKGIIHRDLKPENVFLVAVPGEQTVIKLLDFGIAKLSWQEYGVERTAVGAMMGTPQYMAPEQAKGHAVDGRADIYAFGGILYEMLTGRPVFPADSTAEVLAKHQIDAPPRPSVFAGVPADLDALVVAMLAKQPSARPTLDQICQVLDRHLAERPDPVAAAAIGALPTLQHEVPGVAVPRPRRARRRVALSLALTSAVALVSLVAVRSQAPTGARSIAAGSGSDARSAPSVDPEPAPVVTPPVVASAAPGPAVAPDSKPAVEPKPSVAPDPKPAVEPEPKPSVAPRPKPLEPSHESPVAPDPKPSPEESRPRPARSGHLALTIRGATSYSVIVDGKPQGMRSELALPAGKHDIEVQATGVAPQRFAVQIDAGKTSRREVRWVQAPAATAAPAQDDELLPPGATVPRTSR